MKVTFAPRTLPTSGALVVGVFEGKGLTPFGQELNGLCDGALERTLECCSAFEGKLSQTVVIPLLQGVAAWPVILVGLGKASAVSPTTLESFGASAQAAAANAGALQVAVVAEDVFAAGLEGAEAAARIGFGAALRSYRFDKYHTRRKAEEKAKLAEFRVLTADAEAAQTAYQSFDAVVQGVYLTRDLVNEPANVIHPESFVNACRSIEDLGVGFEVLTESQMRDLGMGALLGVAQGSSCSPRLMILTWNGGKEGDAPTALVGKGVCFDSGGISIKPSAGMEEMKGDMAGAAVVAGVMKALALRKAPVNVIGLCGLVENMPSGMAQRPGDIVTSMSGQTIEVINTDAEGRLVLADVLYYANTRFSPARMIDLATLTGAIMISLGTEYAGLFSNDDALSEALTAAGNRADELVWRMPMNDTFDKLINSDLADMKNTGPREGGSITAAQFLQRFVGKTPWAHLDIAGTAWSKKDKGVVPKGGTGYGVRLLDAYFRDLAG